jgi:hypothetical protein
MYVAANYIPTKKRFRTTLTNDFLPCEASSVDDLRKARKYKTSESAKRAVRKFKAKL